MLRIKGGVPGTPSGSCPLRGSRSTGQHPSQALSSEEGRVVGWHGLQERGAAGHDHLRAGSTDGVVEPIAGKRNPTGRSPPAARLTGEIIDRFIHHAEIISIHGRSYRIQNRPARRPGKQGDYAAAISPLTGRPAQTARTEPKPLARSSEEDDSSTQHPHLVAGFEAPNDTWGGGM
jgi:hypothetical protein